MYRGLSKGNGRIAVISGSAPEGAVLTVTKDFTMYTAPVRRPDGSTGPVLPYPVHRESSTTVARGDTADIDLSTCQQR